MTEKPVIPETPPSLEEWKRLYEIAVRVKEAKIWEWMEEANLFGVQNPETQEIGFISVMGMGGEHFAVGVYRGAYGLYGFYAMQQFDSFVDPQTLLEVPQLQVSFESRRELHEQDKSIIRRLGLKFRGQHEWPMFRTYRPGFFPWMLEADEARFLTVALEQLLDVAPRFRENPKLLTSRKKNELFVRTSRRENDQLIWQDQFMVIDPPEPTELDLAMDLDALEVVKKLPKGKGSIETDFFMLPTPVHERGERPYFPYMLLMVDGASSMILSSEMFQPIPTLESMWELLLIEFVYTIEEIGVIPREIKTPTPPLHQLLQTLGQILGFKATLTDNVPHLDNAQNALFGGDFLPF